MTYSSIIGVPPRPLTNASTFEPLGASRSPRIASAISATISAAGLTFSRRRPGSPWMPTPSSISSAPISNVGVGEAGVQADVNATPKLRPLSFTFRATAATSASEPPVPASESLTTSAGWLMYFFMSCAAIAISAPLRRGDGVADGGAVGLRDGFLDRANDLAGRGHPVVGEDRERRANQVCRDVRE